MSLSSKRPSAAPLPASGPSPAVGSVQQTTTVGIRVDAIPSLAAVLAEIEAAYGQTAHAQSARAQTAHQEAPNQEARAWLMTFANPATAIAAERTPALREMLNQFDRVAPDGTGMVKAITWQHRCSATRISFDSTSLARPVFAMAIARQIGVVLAGGPPGVAQTAQAAIEENFPGIAILASFDGYGDWDTTIQKVIALQPGIVVVGMGTVVQERFLLALVAAGWRGLGFTCGGYLDQLVLKGADYYPAWVDRYNLRFAYRLIMEPGRLWRRYLLEYPKFVIRLCRDLIRRNG